jgi:hypothetical protein
VHELGVFSLTRNAWSDTIYRYFWIIAAAPGHLLWISDQSEHTTPAVTPGLLWISDLS